MKKEDGRITAKRRELEAMKRGFKAHPTKLPELVKLRAEEIKKFERRIAELEAKLGKDGNG